MQSEARKYPAHKLINGVLVCDGFDGNTFRESLNYSVKPNDLFVVTYPKCGTTWTQQIVWLVANKGKLNEKNPNEFMERVPYLEIADKQLVESLPEPVMMKTHLPYKLLPYHPKAKIIYVIRNPFDNVTSFYYHTKNIGAYKFHDGTFDDYFECWMEGRVDYGDYFDHILNWWEHRNDDNVLILVYESMLTDIRGNIRKIAKFMGDEYFDLLTDDVIDNIVEYSSVEHMKKTINSALKDIGKTPMDQLPKHLQVFGAGEGRINKPEFIRKGKMNDWKNLMKKDQVIRLMKKFDERTAGTGLKDLWSNFDWPNIQ